MHKDSSPHKIWKREDENFSQWIAKNLKLLDDILESQLDFVEFDGSVGTLFADILCRNKVDDSNTVIVNQLGPTDPNHLGKLLMYAAGLKAHTIIWIAREFEDEHRDVLDWLNDNMNGNFKFFGVKLDLEYIDSTSCIPKFERVAGPRDSDRQRVDNLEPPYWSAFRKYWSTYSRTRLEPWEFEVYRHPDYFGFHIESLEDIWFGAWRHQSGTQIAAKLFMDPEGKIPYFDRLKEHQGTIEAAFTEQYSITFRPKAQLEWNKKPGFSPHPQVGVYRRGVSNMNEQEQFDWLCKTLGILDSVFGTHISECGRSHYRSQATHSFHEESNRFGDQNDADARCHKYWKEFQYYCDSKSILLDPLPEYLQKHPAFYGFAIKGVPDGLCWLAAWRNVTGTRIAVNLHFRIMNNEPQDIFQKIKHVDVYRTFDTLERQRETIEKRFGQSLTWNRTPNFNAPGPLVGLYWTTRTTEESDWPDQFRWMNKNLEKLNEIFGPHIRDIISFV